MADCSSITDDQEKVKCEIEGLPNKDADAAYMQNIFNGIYGIAGVVAVGFIVYAGIQYIMSSGDPGKIAKAKNTILYSAIGLVIIILAAAITTFVIQTVTQARN